MKIFLPKTLDVGGRPCYNAYLRGPKSVNFAVRSSAEASLEEVSPMEPEKRVVGVKQSRKAIREGRARRVFLAGDADPALTGPIAAECAAAGIPVETERTMAQLGRACGISVGASVAVELTD